MASRSRGLSVLVPRHRLRRKLGGTGTTDRERYFARLPADGDTLNQFFGTGTWAPHGYYYGRTPFTTYNHRRANLWRKYGPDWEADFSDVSHRRLRSWGMNTMANWTDSGIYLLRRTPYVAAVRLETATIEGSEGYWGKFHDVFDPGFRDAVRRGLTAGQNEAVDPWCIGFFVDNELGWGEQTSLALASLACPPSQAAKRVFIEDLQNRYGSIAGLNAAWGTAHPDWQALAEHREAPRESDRARGDLRAFSRRIAETYFRTVREELTTLAPEQLYFGCRFAWQNPIACAPPSSTATTSLQPLPLQRR